MQLSLYSIQRGYESDFSDFDDLLSKVGEKAPTRYDTELSPLGSPAPVSDATILYLYAWPLVSPGCLSHPTSFDVTMTGSDSVSEGSVTPSL